MLSFCYCECLLGVGTPSTCKFTFSSCDLTAICLERVVCGYNPVHYSATSLIWDILHACIERVVQASTLSLHPYHLHCRSRVFYPWEWKNPHDICEIMLCELRPQLFLPVNTSCNPSFCSMVRSQYSEFVEDWRLSAWRLKIISEEILFSSTAWSVGHSAHIFTPSVICVKIHSFRIQCGGKPLVLYYLWLLETA